MTRSTHPRPRPGLLRSRLALTAVAASVALAACGGDEPAGDEPDGEAGESPEVAEGADVSEFNIAWNAQPPTLDPVVTTATTTRDITRNIYEPLLAMDSENELQPVLAESWEEQDDGATIVFTLREGITFHNGDPLTGADAAASLERWFRLSNVGTQFFGGATAEATGELEVTVTTPEPMFTTLMMLGDPGSPPPIMPASVVEAAPDEGTDEIIGTGPYAYGEWATDQFVRLELNEDYAPAPGDPAGMAGDRTGTYESIVYHLVDDSSTRLSGLQSGQYDAANAIPFDNFNQVDSDPNLEPVIQNTGFNALIYNKAEGPMADETMRQAINAALNTEEIQIAAFADDQFYDLNGALMPEDSLWYTEAGLENFNVADPELAEQLLEEAGYDGEPLRLITTREYDDHYDSAVVIQQQLAAVGVEVDMVVTDWATVLENRADPAAYDFFITGFSPTPIPTRYVFFNPEWPGWTEDETIAEAIDSITYAADEDEAMDASDDLQAAFYEYLPVTKFGDRTNITVLRDGIAGYDAPTGVGDVFFRVYPTE